MVYVCQSDEWADEYALHLLPMLEQLGYINEGINDFANAAEVQVAVNTFQCS